MAKKSKEDLRSPEVSASYPSVSEASGLQTHTSDVFVVLTQAFDGEGNPLIRPENPTFDGFPGVTIFLELPDGRTGEVTLSPIHGDERKVGLIDVEPGTPCRLLGRAGGAELEADGSCRCGEGTYRRIYLSPKLSKGEVALICDIWGCLRSRIIDESDPLSWIDY